MFTVSVPDCGSALSASKMYRGVVAGLGAVPLHAEALSTAAAKLITSSCLELCIT
jgi:hypothetical protein